MNAIIRSVCWRDIQTRTSTIDAIVNPMQDQIVSDARPVLLTLFAQLPSFAFDPHAGMSPIFF